MPIGWGSHRSTQRPDQRLYRLIDGCCEPHCQLDVLYASLEEAIADAVAWLEQGGVEGCFEGGLEGCLDSLLALIGVEVCAANGDWRTCRLPAPLLTPLLCPLELAPALG